MYTHTMYAYVQMRTHTCAHIHTHIHIHTCIYIHMHTHTHTYTHTHAQACTYTHAHTHMHIHTYGRSQKKLTFVIVIMPLLQIIVHCSHQWLRSYHNWNYPKLLVCNKLALILYYGYIVCYLLKAFAGMQLLNVFKRFRWRAILELTIYASL